jgi:hypothetical protein
MVAGVAKRFEAIKHMKEIKIDNIFRRDYLRGGKGTCGGGSSYGLLRI